MDIFFFLSFDLEKKSAQEGKVCQSMSVIFDRRARRNSI